MKWMTSVALICGSVNLTLADHITSWGDGDPNSADPPFVINQAAATILIRAGAGANYRFFSETALGSGVPGVINSITIDAAASGNCTLLIDHPTTTPDLPGALHWKAGDLRYTAGTCTIVGIDLAGSICADPSTSTLGNVFTKTVNGSITTRGVFGNCAG